MNNPRGERGASPKEKRSPRDRGLPLLNAEQKRIEYLCEQIEVEKDLGRVAEFARELSDLLEAKAEPLTSPKKP